MGQLWVDAGGPAATPKILVAFSEWLKLGDAATLQGANLAQHPLVTAALNGLASETTFDEAVDATVELVYRTSTGGQPEPSMLPLVSLIVPSVSNRPVCIYKHSHTNARSSAREEFPHQELHRWTWDASPSASPELLFAGAAL